MESMKNNEIEDRLKKLREERIAREKARIEKLKEINLKKYSKLEYEFQPSLSQPVSSVKNNRNSSIPRPQPTQIKPIFKNNKVNNIDYKKRCSSGPPKPDTLTSKPRTIPNRPKALPPNKPSNAKLEIKSFRSSILPTTDNRRIKPESKPVKFDVRNNVQSKLPFKSNTTMQRVTTYPKKTMSVIDNRSTSTTMENMKKTNSIDVPISPNKTRKEVRKTFCFGSTIKIEPKASKIQSSSKLPTPKPFRQPARRTESASGVPTVKQSVFDRLYKPKTVNKVPVDDVTKLKTNPEYLKKVLRDASLITKRHTVYEHPKAQAAIKPVRRSISAVHFKRINKDEISNCIHKWSSIGEKLDKLPLEEINEDDKVLEDRVVSAIKSERKKVKFQTPVPYNFNTPKPEELQEKLQKWLQKRGKSLDSFHHLQCFGLHHLTYRVKPLNLEESKLDNDEENKENIPLESDSDNDSFHDLMTDDTSNDFHSSVDRKSDISRNKWRRASNISDSVDFNESHCTQNTTMTSSETPMPVPKIDELLLGALTDLTEILREGYDWNQCARWLRAIRERFPSAPETAAYWECRAALEERRGDLPTSIHCWENAIAKGTQQSVADANLDQLLDKFMQLKISPNSGKREVDPKLLDVKNIFKSTIIRFAVQQARLRQSSSSPKYICTPVRRSARLSNVRTPLQVCSSVKQASKLHDVKFVPNAKLVESP